jgi:hypothetical protein
LWVVLVQACHAFTVGFGKNTFKTERIPPDALMFGAKQENCTNSNILESGHEFKRIGWKNNRGGGLKPW